jgi:hypothetical protein
MINAANLNATVFLAGFPCRSTVVFGMDLELLDRIRKIRSLHRCAKPLDAGVVHFDHLPSEVPTPERATSGFLDVLASETEVYHIVFVVIVLERIVNLLDQFWRQIQQARHGCLSVVVVIDVTIVLEVELRCFWVVAGCDGRSSWVNKVVRLSGASNITQVAGAVPASHLNRHK